MANLVAKDTASVLRVTCLDQSNAAINLTGATVKLQFYLNNSSTVTEKTMTIVDATNGIVQYGFGFDGVNYDLPSQGTLYYRVKITFSGGTVLTSPIEGQLMIEAPLV